MTETVYVMRWALTRGIVTIPGDAKDDGWFWERDSTYRVFSPKEWSRNRDDALARAEDMRRAKIASLERQIEKLRNMKIKVEE